MEIIAHHKSDLDPSLYISSRLDNGSEDCLDSLPLGPTFILLSLVIGGNDASL